MNINERGVVKSRIEAIASGDFGKLPPPPEHWKTFLAPEVPQVNNYEEVLALSTPDFLAHINELVIKAVDSPDYHDPETGLISKSVWKRLVDGGMLAASLGERDPALRHEEMMHVGRILSYYDLHLGLSIGITTALAIMPLQRFGSKEQQDKYIQKIKDGEMIGLGVTELNRSGSAALDMNSNYTVNSDGTVTLVFEKHLQGLSGQDGLIVAAVKKDAPIKTIGLFIVDQKDIDTQRTQMVGLSGIPYGINRGEVTFDASDHMMTELPRNRLVEFNDMFTKSRFMFVAMTLGNLERTEAEAQGFAEERIIGGVPQAEMPVPQYLLTRIDTRRAVSEALFDYVVGYRTDNGETLLDTDTTSYTMEANIVKTLSTEYALLSAADRAELMGAAAFYVGSALQGYNDIWPFQIFEGSRRMLNTLIGRSFSRSLKDMSKPDDFVDAPYRYQNIDQDMPVNLVLMAKKTKTTVQQEVMGQIALRCFALNCLRGNNLKPEELERAKTMLNLEIKQLVLEFNTLPSA